MPEPLAYGELVQDDYRLIDFYWHPELVVSVIKPRLVPMTAIIDGEVISLGEILSNPKFSRLMRVTRYDVLMRDD